jgi:hypothetical protein
MLSGNMRYHLVLCAAALSCGREVSDGGTGASSGASEPTSGPALETDEGGSSETTSGTGDSGTESTTETGTAPGLQICIGPRLVYVEFGPECMSGTEHACWEGEYLPDPAGLVCCENGGDWDACVVLVDGKCSAAQHHVCDVG